MDFGNDLRVVAAEDRAFRGTIVCILSVTLNDSVQTPCGALTSERRALQVKEWLRDGLPSRCKLYHPHVLKLYDVGNPCHGHMCRPVHIRCFYLSMRYM